MAKKYKVGDVVKVREDLKLGEAYYMEDRQYVDSFIRGMDEYLGKNVTILQDQYSSYRIKEDCSLNWTDEMFEGLAVTEVAKPKAKIKITGLELDLNNQNVRVYDDGAFGINDSLTVEYSEIDDLIEVLKQAKKSYERKILNNEEI